MKTNRILFAVFLLMISPFVFAFNSAYDEIKKAANHWQDAVSEKNPKKIADLYDQKAFFYPTTANYIDDRDGLMKYFSRLKKDEDLKVTFMKQNIKVSGDMAVMSGFYAFSHTEQGKTVSFPSRYTFVYQRTPQGWLIVDHHSSKMPEKLENN